VTAGFLAAQHSLTDPSLARALFDVSSSPLPFFPLTVLTATLAVGILQGAIGARWVGWFTALVSVACLVTAVIGSLDTTSSVPPFALLGFAVTVIALSVSLFRVPTPA